MTEYYDSRPAFGLIQDTVLAASRLTGDLQTMDRMEFMQVMMHADRECEELPIPAILKPAAMWTGHQAFSLAFPEDLSMVMRETKKKAGVDALSARLPDLVIREGQLLRGTLNKTCLGPTGGGIVHHIGKLIDPDEALRFMERAQHICCHWLSLHGVSVGLKDCKVRESLQVELDTKLNEITEHAKQLDALGLELGLERTERENAVHECLAKALAVVGDVLKSDPQPHNALTQMIEAGSKGSYINGSRNPMNEDDKCLNALNSDVAEAFHLGCSNFIASFIDQEIFIATCLWCACQ